MASKHTGKTILLVDDERFFLRFLSGCFAPRGYQVLTASNGTEALEQAQRFRPDVIVLDVEMPAPDGIETCRALKADEATRPIPVIIITGTENPKLNAIAFEAGAEATVFKSVDGDRLLNIVKTVLQTQQASDPL
ncbi:MAG: PleD family two-component system response regulator [Candidatus Methylomirabilales bacterium]